MNSAKKAELRMVHITTALISLMIVVLFVGDPAAAQGFAVGGARPGQDAKFKLHVEVTQKDRVEALTFPKLGVAVPIGENLEVGADLPFRAGFPRGARRQLGVPEIELKAKYGLLEATGNNLALDAAIELKLILPLAGGETRLGDGAIGIKLPFTFARRFGAYEVGGLLGVQHIRQRDKDRLIAGLLIARHFSRWKIGTELVTEAPLGQIGRLQVVLNAGAKLTVEDRSEFFILIGRSLDRGSMAATHKLKIGWEVKL